MLFLYDIIQFKEWLVFILVKIILRWYDFSLIKNILK